MPDTQQEIIFRTAQPSDWPKLSALLTQAKLPLAGAQEHLAGFLLAFRADELIGSTCVERYDQDGLLRSVAVTESQRGQQLGSALVARTLVEAKRQGLAHLVLLTETAEAFFTRFGFHRIARADAPLTVQSSVEFQSVCPQSAVAMLLDLKAETGNTD
jgi:amino-acid N-acetyltransferase